MGKSYFAEENIQVTAEVESVNLSAVGASAITDLRSLVFKGGELNH
jgi:hypothetical protein